ncbi:MAG: rubrerythrin family protein [Deltaproteobacteria bacterium]|jgi:rubrerythrin|nr:rubrerythrin family protein [Deltaproteobacteria bacterium]
MTKTNDNLITAFAGESQARNKYYFYAEIARQEGYHYIAKIFEETAQNEMYHAMEEYRLLLGEKNTISNLKDAIESEKYEVEEMYPKFAKEAEIEGNKKASILFSQISKIEKSHLDRFNNLLKLVESGKVYKRDKEIRWKCSICGYTHQGYEPPSKCPYCKHPKEYYEPANLDV